MLNSVIFIREWSCKIISLLGDKGTWCMLFSLEWLRKRKVCLYASLYIARLGQGRKITNGKGNGKMLTLCFLNKRYMDLLVLFYFCNFFVRLKLFQDKVF